MRSRQILPRSEFMKVYLIESANYDGCNGWTYYLLDDLAFATKEGAKKYISNHLKSQYTRYNAVEVEVKE